MITLGNVEAVLRELEETNAVLYLQSSSLARDTSIIFDEMIIKLRELVNKYKEIE